MHNAVFENVLSEEGKDRQRHTREWGKKQRILPGVVKLAVNSDLRVFQLLNFLHFCGFFLLPAGGVLFRPYDYRDEHEVAIKLKRFLNELVNDIVWRCSAFSLGENSLNLCRGKSFIRKTTNFVSLSSEREERERESQRSSSLRLSASRSLAPFVLQMLRKASSRESVTGNDDEERGARNSADARIHTYTETQGESSWREKRNNLFVALIHLPRS